MPQPNCDPDEHWTLKREGKKVVSLAGAQTGPNAELQVQTQLSQFHRLLPESYK